MVWFRTLRVRYKTPPLSDHVLLNKMCFIILKITSSIRPPPLCDPFFSDIGWSYIRGSTAYDILMENVKFINQAPAWSSSGFLILQKVKSCYLIALSLSFSVPLYLWGYLFKRLWSFYTSSFYQLWSRSPRILQQPQSVFEGAHLHSFVLLCVGALSSIITGHRGLLFFKEWNRIFRAPAPARRSSGWLILLKLKSCDLINLDSRVPVNLKMLLGLIFFFFFFFDFCFFLWFRFFCD